VPNHPWKFHPNLFLTFWDILRTESCDRTNRQTNRQGWKHNLLGGGNYGYNAAQQKTSFCSEPWSIIYIIYCEVFNTRHQLKQLSTLLWKSNTLSIFPWIFCINFYSYTGFEVQLFLSNTERIIMTHTNAFRSNWLCYFFQNICTFKIIVVWFSTPTKQRTNEPHLLFNGAQSTVNSVCCHHARSKSGRSVEGDALTHTQVGFMAMYQGVPWSAKNDKCILFISSFATSPRFSLV
jgi:hypothetical protein